MMSIPITLLPDDKGYFDRECPNEYCRYTFKILMEDWKEKISDDEVHCPLCGYVASSDKWWTQYQIHKMNEIAKEMAFSYIHKELDKSFKKLERSTHNKLIRFTYKPYRRISFFNNPIVQMDELETEIRCEKCGTKYSVIGSAYFCPCCCYNSAINSYTNSIDSIEKMIDSLHEIKAISENKYIR